MHVPQSVHVTIRHVRKIRSAKGGTPHLLGIVESALVPQAIVHKVRAPVGGAQGAQQPLARMRIGHRGPIEDDISQIVAILPLVAGAAVGNLLVAIGEVGRRQASDDLAAVQVAVLEKETLLLRRVVGEVPNGSPPSSDTAPGRWRWRPDCWAAERCPPARRRWDCRGRR